MHHQGGPTGYGCREFTVTPETKGVIKKNQAYAWNPTIAGTKCEDTTFLADNGVEIFTRTKAWPCTVIETEYGSCSVALGGGGHLMMAGAQLQNCTLQDAERRIREQIDLYRAAQKENTAR